MTHTSPFIWEICATFDYSVWLRLVCIKLSVEGWVTNGRFPLQGKWRFTVKSGEGEKARWQIKVTFLQRFRRLCLAKCSELF